jgi:pimeloyl-ACP methyl ester carboxylesterase
VAHHTEAHIRGFISTNGPHPARFTDLIANDPEQTSASAYMDFFRSEAAENYLTPDRLAEDLFPFLSEEDLIIYRQAWSQPGAITGGLNWYRANPLTMESVATLMAPLSPTIPVPVSVLWGEDDESVLVQNADGLEPYAPDLTVTTYPGVDHWIEHRIPKDIAEAIIQMDTRAQ